MGKGPAEEGIKGLLTAKRLGHDANQLLLDIMDRWGGTVAFADSVFEEFGAANRGSLIRQNLLEMIQKLVVNNTNHNITRIIDPKDLDDEEIEAEINAAIVRAKEFMREQADRSTAPATYGPPGPEEPPDDWDWDSR